MEAESERVRSRKGKEEWEWIGAEGRPLLSFSVHLISTVCETQGSRQVS